MTSLKHSLLAFIACASFSAHSESLRVYAASSMTNVVNDLVEQYEKSNDASVTTVFGGSASLARQLAQGAPADIYISANQKWMDYLVEQSIVNGDGVTNIAANSLVAIAPKGHLLNLDVDSEESWISALAGYRLAIGQTNAVPAGMYAKQALVNLGVWDEVKTQLAPTNNVRIALMLVERGESPLGIVYKTDALLSDKVEVVATLPSSAHANIVYPMAPLNEKIETQRFVKFIHSQQAQSVFKQYGFTEVVE
ncbi:molybdate ABC transporter substrate-binding protein [Vibrio europaeus]|uniref:molybdate ABC transporter substrate-binding protein n=1 Tax=Vibrio europaeus TaxID=300876 RepID=UPI0023422314|nr:molybdate ABC transporter substrate-binding protein [Vibrio europaeus]MDC5842395.1 molybdate ABC transporter substrate-binding protein [Vibrio europaeus]MDC5852191.1 molybdate ABC transporter substrate-binding protein [Vibrio europaeus]